MLFASESLTTASAIDAGNLEFWVVLTNVAIVIATLMLTKATVKDAQLHEERVIDKTAENTHDITEILHDVLVKDGLVRAADVAEQEVEATAPIRAVK